MNYQLRKKKIKASLLQKDSIKERQGVETQNDTLKENKKTENMWVNNLISEDPDLERQERITGRERIISPAKAESNFVRRQRNISSEMHKNIKRVGQPARAVRVELDSWPKRSALKTHNNDSEARVFPDEARIRALADDARVRGFQDESRVRILPDDIRMTQGGARVPHPSLLTKRRRWLGDVRDDEIPPRGQRRTERIANSRSALLKRYGIQGTPTHSKSKPHLGNFGSRRGFH